MLTVSRFVGGFVVALKGGVKTAVIVYLSVMILQFVVMLTMQLKSRHQVVGEEKATDLAQDMLMFGLRAYPGSLGHLLLTRVPVFILNVTHGPAAVGIFSVAQQAVEKFCYPWRRFRMVFTKRCRRCSGLRRLRR